MARLPLPPRPIEPLPTLTGRHASPKPATCRKLVGSGGIWWTRSVERATVARSLTLAAATLLAPCSQAQRPLARARTAAGAAQANRAPVPVCERCAPDLQGAFGFRVGLGVVEFDDDLATLFRG